MTQFNAFVFALTFFASTAFSWPQQATSPSPAEVTPSSPNVLPNKGSIEQGVYKNPSIGIELKPPDNLHLEDPEMKGTPGTVPLLIVVAASGDGPPSELSSLRTLMVFDADALAYYPADQRNLGRYVDKVIRANEAEGYKTVTPATAGDIDEVSVARVDFVKGEVHESVLVTIHDAYAFVFIFAGSDFKVINKSITSTKVKLTPVPD